MEQKNAHSFRQPSNHDTFVGTEPVQAQDRSGVAPPNNRYCLQQRMTGATNCMFATMRQCQKSANVGREGICIRNPALTRR